MVGRTSWLSPRYDEDALNEEPQRRTDCGVARDGLSSSVLFLLVFFLAAFFFVCVCVCVCVRVCPRVAISLHRCLFLVSSSFVLRSFSDTGPTLPGMANQSKPGRTVDNRTISKCQVYRVARLLITILKRVDRFSRL